MTSNSPHSFHRHPAAPWAELRDKESQNWSERAYQRLRGCTAECTVRWPRPSLLQVAALAVMEKDPQGVALLMPSDHVVADRAAFQAAVATAAKAAAKTDAR